MKCRVAVFVLLILCLGITTTLLAKAPAPPDVSIVRPDPSLPDEIKALSGTWIGKWDSPNPWDCAIFIERVGRDSALVTHAWGDYSTAHGSCHCSPDYVRIHRAEVSSSGGKATIEFQVNYRNHRKTDVKNRSNDPDSARRKGSFVSLVLEKNAPNVMKGKMISGHNHVISIILNKVE